MTTTTTAPHAILDGGIPLLSRAYGTAGTSAHPFTRSAPPLKSVEQWRPTIIENVGGDPRRITVRWDPRRSFPR